MANSTHSRSNSPASLRRLRGLLFLLSFVLAVAGIVLWTAPQREERRWQNASLPQLIAAYQHDPTNPRLLHSLGLRAHQAGRSQLARSAFTTAADLEPDNEDIWIDWASTELEGDDIPQAQRVLAQFIGAHPESSRAHYALAVLFQRINDHQRAYKAAAKATGFDSHNVGAWQIMAAEAGAMERHKDAETAWRHALSLDDQEWHSHLGLGDSLYA